MVSFITKNNIFYKRQEIWFYKGEDISFYDNNLFYQAELLPDNILIDVTNKFYTSCVDLTLTEDALFKNIEERFRTYIRKAEKEGCIFECVKHPTYQDFLQYMDLYGQFCRIKKMLPPDKNRMKALFESDNFILTKVIYAGKEILTHTYIFDNERIRLLNSFHNTSFQNPQLRGFANKFFHWKDIQLFKKMNFLIYDFGGIDKNKDDGRSKFKIAFGGYDEQSFDFIALSGIYKQVKKIIS